MIDEGRPDFVVALPGGVGTADMVRKARAAGIPTHIVQSRRPAALFPKMPVGKMSTVVSTSG